jgi:streptogramin lyase
MPGFMTGYTLRDGSSPIIGTGTPGSADGSEVTASFNYPGDVALSWDYKPSYYERHQDAAVYIADTGNHAIRRIRFRFTFDLCGQPYTVETLATGFNAPRGVAAAPDRSVYVADTGNHVIRRIAPDGTVTTVAGKVGEAGSNDGPGAEARLSSPSGIDVNRFGEVFIADTGNFTIRKLTTDGRLITIAGTPGVAGFADGPAREALFSGVVGLRLYGNWLYLADTANNVIRKFDPTSSEPRRRAARH